MRYILGLLLLCLCTSLAVPDSVEPLSDDFKCLAWVIKDEARGEPLKGQRAVLDVVLKRIRMQKKTACEIVQEKAQFSGWHKGMKIELHKNLQEKDLTRLDELLRMSPVVKEADHFHADYVKPNWRTKMKRLIQVGKHIFYQNKEKTK